MHKNRGVSLVNLLIGLALGVTVSGAVIQSVFSLKQTYYQQKSNVDLFENGRYAIHLLRKIIGNQGYLGCFNGVPVNVISSQYQLNGLANYTSGILGYEGSNNGFSPSLSAYLNGLSIKSDTDVISIAAMNTNNYNLLHATSNTDDDLVVSDELDAIDGDVLVISDCEQANLFRVSQVTKNSGQETLRYDGTYNIVNQNNSNNTNLSKSYGLSAKVGKFKNQTFYLTTNAKGNSALWLNWLSNGGVNNASELIEGVESFKILYGVDDDDDGSANAYLSASKVSSWANVVSVKLYLLMKSLQAADSKTTTYTFMGKTYSANNGYARQEFSTTISLNN